ncbi:MAG: CYTH domain-containing protein [Victivallaceae bacterium]|nr:CYTH domain-containing protein [Victivallaceae bacterium]
MGVEIERKFLVRKPLFERAAAGIEPVAIVQGYLESNGRATVRVRIAGDRAFLTVKGRIIGISRSEFEYQIPREDAEQMLLLASGGVIKKKRYNIPVQDHVWEVDVFEGDNAGLIVAEIELKREDEPFAMPDFAAKEVTGIERYYNGSLMRRPFNTWTQDRPPHLE